MNKISYFFSTLPKPLRIAIFAAFGFLIIAIITTTVIAFLPKEYDRITITNPETIKNVPQGKQNDFKLSLLKLLQDNNLISSNEKVNDVTIRADTVSEATTTNRQGTTKTTSFIFDIDSLKQTYSVNIYDANYQLTDMDIVITCPNTKESKYPESTCNGNYGSSSNKVKNHLPYETTLSTGEKIRIKELVYGSRGGPTIEIYLFSCNSHNIGYLGKGIKGYS